MIVTIHGTRGSLPACGTQFAEFGGHTSCISIDRLDGTMLVVDAGSGIYNLGKQLQGSHDQLTLLFTHFHWDHIQGLPFFAPLYHPERVVTFTALDVSKQSLMEQALAKQMDPEFFPIRLEQTPANIEFKTLADPTIETIRLNHPGGCTGFKITSPAGKTMAYMVDHEINEGNRQQFVDFCKGVDVLIHDAHYTHSQYQRYVGWGHTSCEEAIRFAMAAEVGRVILTHHHPDHDDAFLTEQERLCQQSFAHCALAREQMSFEL